MKCVKSIAPESDGSFAVLRVTDAKAQSLVKSGQYNYCPKFDWKMAKSGYAPLFQPETTEPATAAVGN